jgi:YegS/Rv2252/BmrU family lipid kinase
MSETVIILNPKSGTGDHADAVTDRAQVLDHRVERTGAKGDGVDLAREAAEAGAEQIVAAGGDGTVNEVVRGIDKAGAFDRVTLGIVPVGTGNNFAGQLGITDLDTAFNVIEEGERRWIDLGEADGHAFVNSCVAGLTSDSSSKTDPGMKDRLGVVAYVVTTLQSMVEFDSMSLTVETEEGGDRSPAWRGDALAVLIGNGRRFAAGGDTQANMEDGLFEVTIVEDVSTLDLMGEAVADQLLGGESDAIVRTRTPSIRIEVHDPQSRQFSLDGEIIERDNLSVDIRPSTLSVAVGEGYQLDPGVE